MVGTVEEDGEVTEAMAEVSLHFFFFYIFYNSNCNSYQVMEVGTVGMVEDMVVEWEVVLVEADLEEVAR